MPALHLTETEARILQALFLGGCMHRHELADDLDLPPYLIRGGLKKLARERLVEDWITSRGHTWKITDRGLSYVNRERQLELGG